MKDSRRAILRWRDGRELTATIDDGWVCADTGFAELLNRGWPLRKRTQRPGHDLLASLAREVAKIFSADVVLLKGSSAGTRAPEARSRGGSA
ncbi:MAG TPA: hypothetical protein VFD92_22180 [Candidatus Binatia bacterium]|nr:hypothetical protein [Candidatus Binatia bacterium]